MILKKNSESYLYKPPSWLIRRGNFVIFGILFTAFCLSFVIRYNDTISSEIVLTTLEPPVNVLSKKKGRITKVNFQADQLVKRNQILAVLENTSDEEDVAYLLSDLSDNSLEIRNIQELFKNYPSDLVLESDIQFSYQKFISNYSRYILYDLLDEQKLEVENIDSRLQKTKSVAKNKELQLGSFSTKLRLSKNTYNRQKSLFTKGVISKQELEQFQQDYLNSIAEYQNFKQELELLYMDSLSLKNQGVKTNNLDIINGTLFYSELLLSKQELLSKINEWEDINILKSPIDGKVTIFDIWNKNQIVSEGEKIFTVIPLKENDFVAKCKVPIRNSGNIKLNQKVVIYLDNYPSNEWGNLVGKVSGISEVPKEGRESYYSVYVEVSGLKTTYGKNIDFKQEMYGTAKIILEETSLITRVFYEFRNIWSKMRN